MRPEGTRLPQRSQNACEWSHNGVIVFDGAGLFWNLGALVISFSVRSFWGSVAEGRLLFFRATYCSTSCLVSFGYRRANIALANELPEPHEATPSNRSTGLVHTSGQRERAQRSKGPSPPCLLRVELRKNPLVQRFTCKHEKRGDVRRSAYLRPNECRAKRIQGRSTRGRILEQ